MDQGQQRWIGCVLFVSLILLWVHAIHTIYVDSGLFWWVGTDFAQYYGQAMALWSGDARNIYRPESYSQLYQDLLSRYIVNQEPVPPTSVPYPPIFAWLFTPFTIPPPPVGFMLWECLNVLAAVYLAWRTMRFFPAPMRPMVGLLILTSYPVVETLLVAQPQLLLACAVAECYLALRKGQDVSAGLWLSCLLIKPQYGLLIGLFLIWKRRWHAVAGAALGGLVVVGGSILVAGWEGLLAYPDALKEMAVFQGYWEQNMINWRSLVLAARPGVSTLKGMLLTQILSAATVFAVMMVCRGPWMERTPVFPVQFTLVLLATLLATHHSMTYGAVILTLPLGAVFSEGLASPWTRWSILCGAVVPTLTFTLFKFLNVPVAARFLTFALLGCFISLLFTAWRFQQERVSWQQAPHAPAV